MFSSQVNGALLAFATAVTLCGFINAQALGSKDLFRCRQSCYQKFVQDWHHCMDFEDCKNMCITPPNINSYIPEAFSFLCWNNCDQQLGPFQLNINSALRQGSLVITDIGWDQAITNASKQCLVTWEVSGGGLMGNLLTDSSSVELSLWLDTVYHVQVTCKHKETGGMRRSYKLIVDTHKLSDDSMATGLQAIALDTTQGAKTALNNIYAAGETASSVSSTETDSRLRILKDSSKDFLSPYNPNADVATANTKDKSISTERVQVTEHLDMVSANSVSDTQFPTADDLTLRRQAADFLTQSIVMAIAGSVVLFFVLLVVYALTRTAPKELPAAIDKELLIHSEMLPSQTPAARQQQQQQQQLTANAFSLPDSRTLHV